MSAPAPGAGGVWRIERYESLPSTSDLCIARAHAGEAAGLVVLAGRQSGGRGRAGRVWLSPPGNLALSLLLRPETPLAEAGQWALVAGVTLIEALLAVLPRAAGRLALKWPNDVMLEGDKLAGILIDSAAGAAGRMAWLVLGFGANLATAPELAERPTAALAGLAPPPSPETLAAALLERLDAWQAVWRERGFDPLRETWLRHAHPLGTALSLIQGARPVTGRFAGLSPTGALLLDTGDGIEGFSTGDVMLGTASRSAPQVVSK